MGRIIGIDLGTTNSEAAVIENGRPVIIPVDEEKILPSVVGIDPAVGSLLVGAPARNQYVAYPGHTVRSIKRRMGTPDKVRLGKKEFSPEQISSLILGRLKAAAEDYLKEEVTRAVITVPAYFNDLQRRATKAAGELAGLEVVRILNEPTAAALAHGLNRQDSQICLVYDLGGGTFDVSVVERVGEVVEVLASHGNTQLGGDDFDRILRSRLIAGFREDSGADLSKDLRALARLTFAAEQAKIRLSSEPFAVVAEEFIASRDGAPLNLHREISRREFEQWIAALVESTRESIRQALSDAGLAADRVQKVLLVGGSTHIPLVWELIEGELGQAPHAEVDPALAVALGAAIQAGIIANESVDMILVDVAAHSLGIEVLEDSQHLLIPDAFSRIIPRNTVLPAQKSEVYSTSTDYQKAASIRIYQGEHEVTSRNTLLGEFLVDGLRRAPAGEVEIVVSFAYDTSGLLHVTASERGAGTSRELTVRTLEPSSAAEPASDPPAADGRTGASASTESRVLLGRARAVLDRLSGDSRGRLEAAIRRLEQALPAGGSEAEEAQQELLDLLYELEE